MLLYWKNKEANEDMIRDYSKEETNSDTFIIEKLKNNGDFASFELGVPFELKERSDNEDYWPISF